MDHLQQQQQLPPYLSILKCISPEKYCICPPDGGLGSPNWEGFQISFLIPYSLYDVLSLW